MAKVFKNLSGLYNGISQQAPELRLDNQCETQLNLQGHLVRGLEKRPGTILNQVISPTAADKLAGSNSYVHPIDRSANEKYMVWFSNISGTHGQAAFDVLRGPDVNSDLLVRYANAAAETYVRTKNPNNTFLEPYEDIRDRDWETRPYISH